MLQKKRFKASILLLLLFLMGYVRHWIILHLNVAQGQSQFEFWLERSAAFLQSLSQLGAALGVLELLAQSVFALLSCWISYHILLFMGASRKRAGTFIICFILLFLFSALFTVVSPPAFTGYAATVFVKLQGPLPLFIFYLIHKAGIIGE